MAISPKTLFRELQKKMTPKLIKTSNFRDFRGYFYESYNEKKINLKKKFVQDNIAYSKFKGTIRGLHFQKKPFSQDKLIRVIRGSIQDVVVDIRLNSKSFGKYKTFILNEKNKNQLFVPSGFAHGYCSLEDDTIVHYKVSKYYNPNSEITIKWNDEDLKIKWKIHGLIPHISIKDKQGLNFYEIKNKKII